MPIFAEPSEDQAREDLMQKALTAFLPFGLKVSEEDS